LFLLAPLALIAFAEPADAATTQVPADQPSIQAAIAAALPGDEIIVAPGIYWETIDFLGKPITLKSSGGPLVTVIDGSQASGPVVQAVSGEGADTVIEGFTVTGGNVSDVGGGMRNIDSSPTVIDMIFTDNHAGDRGGGMYNRNANPLVMNSLFEGNSAVEMGGGMFNIEGSGPTIIGSRFSANTSNKGAGMRNYLNSHAYVSQSIFSSNHAGDEGGGMDNRKNSNATVIDTAFIGNTAGSGGGAIHNYVGRAVDTGDQLFINLLIAANSAPSGAGIRNNDESPTIVNSTIVDNIGSGISSRKGSAPVLLNTVVWGNTGGSFSGQTASSTVASYSNIEGGYPGMGNMNVDPLFENPAANDYRLAVNSPLIDAGDASHPLVPAQDLDGNPRVIGDAIDMGAYEYGDCPAGETCGPGNTAPIASFDFVCTDLSCSFQDTSEDGDGIVDSWLWSFGDGNGSNARNPIHEYADAGVYAVTLMATDNDGAPSLPAVQQVMVGEPPAGIAIDMITPDTVGIPSAETVTITGSGFAADAQVSLSGGSGPISVSNVEFHNATTISATIVVKNGGPPRSRVWDLTVTSNGSSATLPNGFTVLP
jgi:predicted outer membrane repeat protein